MTALVFAYLFADAGRVVLAINGLMMLTTGVAFHIGSHARRWERLERQVSKDHIDEKTATVLGSMLASLYVGFGVIALWRFIYYIYKYNIHCIHDTYYARRAKWTHCGRALLYICCLVH